jgi:hypothetical protein
LTITIARAAHHHHIIFIQLSTFAFPIAQLGIIGAVLQIVSLAILNAKFALLQAVLNVLNAQVKVNMSPFFSGPLVTGLVHHLSFQIT